MTVTDARRASIAPGLKPGIGWLLSGESSANVGTQIGMMYLASILSQ
jgi:hypothetical protein